MTRKEAVATGAIGALLAWTWLWRGHQLERAMDGPQTVGTITAVGGKNLTVSFSTTGTQRQDVLSRPYTPLYAGERYVLSYDPTDPTITVMRFWQPVYDKRHYTQTTPTRWHRPWAPWGDSYVVFAYTVAGKSYERVQGLMPGRPWKEALVTSVYYQTADPRIAYVEF